MEVELFVNENNISLNEFVKKILGGMVSGAVLSLRGVDKNWKKIRIEISK